MIARTCSSYSAIRSPEGRKWAIWSNGFPKEKERIACRTKEIEAMRKVRREIGRRIVARNGWERKGATREENGEVREKEVG